MALMLDYSGLRPSATRLKAAKAAKVTGVLRYICPPNSACDWKRVSKAEINTLRGLGLEVVLNWEWYEGRCLEGAAAGKQDGQWAYAAARALGYAKGASIYASHDTSARNDSRVLAYYRAFSLALRGYYRVDAYGGIDHITLCHNAGLAPYGWQTLAWSNGKIGSCHLYQNGRKWFSGDADENSVRHLPLGGWNETLAKTSGKHGVTPKPAPAKKPPAATKPKPVGKPAAKPTTHSYTVKDGDSLSRIALSYHTTVGQLVRLNRSAHPSLTKQPGLIRIGWKLTVPGAKKPAKPAPARVYVVHEGDTLSAIAKHFGVSVAQLQKWNRSSYSSLAKHPGLIRIGWHLKVAA